MHIFGVSDNALYRIGSQHIAPLFSKSPSHRKRSGTYEYPVNPDDDNNNSNGTPSHDSVAKKQQKATSIGSVVAIEGNPKKEMIDSNTYSIPRSRAETVDSHTYAVPGSTVAVNLNRSSSNDYSVPSSLPLKENSYVNHVIDVHVTLESPVGSEHKLLMAATTTTTTNSSNSTDQKMESGDYIYMSSCPEGAEVASSTRESAASYDTEEV